MKVLLVYTNRYQYLSPPPIGLAYLITPLKQRGHEVKLLDLMFAKLPMQELISTLEFMKPDIVGLSIRDLDNQFMLGLENPLPEIKEFVTAIKDKGITTVLGGPAFSTLPAEMLKFMEADYGISGQGEESFPLLIEALESHQSITDIPGIAYWEQGTVQINSPVVTGYVGQSKPDWSMIDLRLYTKKAVWTPPAGILIKSGCPLRCSHCNVGYLNGPRFIIRDIDEIIDDIKIMKRQYQQNWFFLIDPCFNTPLDFAKELLHRIIQEKLGIRFVTRINPIHNAFDSEFIQLYTRAGGQFGNMGVDSFSDQILENYQKDFCVEDIIHFSDLANQYGLRTGMELLFGGPGETQDTIRETLAHLPKIKYSFLSYAIGIRINPNTAIFETAKEEGVIQESSELLFSKFYLSKDFDMEWAKTYISHSIKKYNYRYIKLLPIAVKNTFQRLTV